MATHEAEYQPRSLHPLIRWAAFVGIALLGARRLLYAIFPDLLPSSAWGPEHWGAGLLINALFELVLLVFLLGVPYGIYRFRLRGGQTNARDLLTDCAAAVGLYVSALLWL